MNWYITTTAFFNKNVSHGENRKDGYKFKKTLLDVCIKSYEDCGVKISKIFTPLRFNPDGIEEFNGIPVESIKTHVNFKDPYFNMCKEFSKCIETFENSQIDGNCILDFDSIKYKTRSLINYDDNEHAILFQKMNVNYPCVISDGDVLVENIDFERLNEIQSPASIWTHLCLVRSELEKNSLSYDIENISGKLKGIIHTHISDNYLNMFKKYGYDLEITKMS